MIVNWKFELLSILRKVEELILLQCSTTLTYYPTLGRVGGGGVAKTLAKQHLIETQLKKHVQIGTER